MLFFKRTSFENHQCNSNPSEKTEHSVTINVRTQSNCVQTAAENYVDEIPVNHQTDNKTSKMPSAQNDRIWCDVCGKSLSQRSSLRKLGMGTRVFHR